MSHYRSLRASEMLRLSVEGKAVVGKCHAVTFEPRGEGDPHIMVCLWVEDDEFFYEKQSYSSHWHAEFTDLMRKANKVLKNSEPDPSGYGYVGKPGGLRRQKNTRKKES